MTSRNRSIWTVGHSTRSLDAFLDLLQRHEMERIADVRRYPGSRRYPHFNEDALRAGLDGRGLGYVHFSDLGGRRGKPAEESPNTAWRVVSFRAYADYMATDEFATALARLEEEARNRRTAIMCAEAVPWRCHRRLIADALIVRNWQVFDIMAPEKARRRELTRFARLDNGRLIYPSGDDSGTSDSDPPTS